MKRLSSYPSRFQALLSGWPCPGFRTLACLIVITFLQLGLVMGRRDAAATVRSTNAYIESIETRIRVVEEMTILADLDASATGLWDGYLAHDTVSVVSKGGMPRIFRSPGPYVHKSVREPRFPLTRTFTTMDVCRTPLRTLAQGPLAERIQVSIRAPDTNDSLPLTWMPIDNIGNACDWKIDQGRVSFRIVPSTDTKPSSALR